MYAHLLSTKQGSKWINNSTYTYQNWNLGRRLRNEISTLQIGTAMRPRYNRLIMEHKTLPSPYILRSIKHEEIFTALNVTRLCAAVSVVDLSDGEWLHIRCTQRMASAAVICQRSRDVDSNGTSIKIKRSAKECKLYELNLSQYCLRKTTQFELIKLDDMNKLSAKELTMFNHYLSINFILEIALVYSRNSCQCYTSRHILLDIPVHHTMSYSVEPCDCSNVSMWMLFSKLNDIDANVCGGNLMFRCTDGTCILNRYVCDEFRDCPDSSDETGKLKYCLS